jgi:DNA processing protein
LKDGAKIVESADDILEELGWAGAPDPGARRCGRTRAMDPLLGTMDTGEPYGLDELVQRTGIAAAKLLPRLMELELLGYITASGGRFVKTC